MRAMQAVFEVPLCGVLPARSLCRCRESPHKPKIESMEGKTLQPAQVIQMPLLESQGKAVAGVQPSIVSTKASTRTD
jgi:hypothetical protein